jgi:uncharacterized protein (TIGR02300 family)
LVKPDWGLKRTCQSCGTRFYDMTRSPIRCPKCSAVFDPEATLKTRRTKAVAAAPVERPVPVPAEADELEPIAAEGEEGVAAEAEEEEAIIEDTSELGEDKEDVAEVIDNVDEEGEDR